MSVMRALGWSMGLTGLAGGIFWFVEATPLTAVGSKAITESPQALGAAPGLVTADAMAPASESDVETRLQRLESQMQVLIEQSKIQQQNANRSHEELTRLTRALEQARKNVTDVVEDESQQAEPLSPEAGRMAEAAQIALLDRQVSAERADPRWSERAANQIRATIMDGGFTGLALESVTCQATLCRLEVEHRNSMALDQFIGEFFARLSWDTNSYSQTTVHDDGRATLVLYIGREGYELPQPNS
ncbi:MAG TPA: hypothetical protein PKY50_02725 [Candidatus Competibacter sp.]|nr:hypothetical protein [Candidatus Competibacter sp.]